MNEIQVFNNAQFGNVRVIMENGKPLFCGSDVAKALGYARPNDAVSTHCKGTVKRSTLTNGGNQTMLYIPEGDLYRLVTHSQLPEAERFESWIFDEVLPSIRKTGAYLSPVIDSALLFKMAEAMREKEKRISALEEEKQAMLPKAEYFDALVDRNLLTNFRETAKQLHIQQKQFIQFLLDGKYIYRDARGKLMPYAPHVENGLFEVKECLNDHSQWSGTQTLVTPKGRETFRLLL